MEANMHFIIFLRGFLLWKPKILFKMFIIKFAKLAITFK